MLRVIVDWFVYSVLGLDPGGKWGNALHFFIYDSVKITALLFVMIAVIAFLRSFLSQKKLRQWLTHNKRSHVYAAFFGAVTPFCSCSSIPIFISLLRAGIPLGVSFSFLITSPLINEYLVILMIGYFGLKVTACYVVNGILIGMFGGMILGAMKLERYLVENILVTPLEEDMKGGRTILDRASSGVFEASSIVRKLWVWILTGVGIGSLIHNFVPQEMIESMIGRAGIWSVPLATILGVPFYGSCAAIVPVAVVLFQKGVPLGVALSFMMAIVGLSLPEAIMLRSVIRLPLIGIFFGVTALAIMLTGYVFNFLF